METSFCSHPSCGEKIDMKFYTWNYNCTIVACARFWNDMIYTTAYIPSNSNCEVKSFLKWAHACMSWLLNKHWISQIPSWGSFHLGNNCLCVPDGIHNCGDYFLQKVKTPQFCRLTQKRNMQKVYQYKQTPFAANDMGTRFTKHLHFYSDSIKRLDDLLCTIITPIVFIFGFQLDAGSHVAVLLGVFHRWYYQCIHYQNDIGLNNSKGYFP